MTYEETRRLRELWHTPSHIRTSAEFDEMLDLRDKLMTLLLG